MLTLLSPAKSLDFEADVPSYSTTTPAFLEDSEKLIKKLRTLSVKQISKLMGLSSNLAELNHQRYAMWHPDVTKANAKPALFVFRGDVYRGMNAAEFSSEDVAYAQDRLRILSGLYGVLKPLDLMQAYRLEMGTRLPVTKAKNNLYKFWGNALSDHLNESAKAIGAEAVLNLASNEYFKAVQTDVIDLPIIHCQFKDFKNGTYKSIMTYAKIARGLMASYVIRNRVEKAEDLKGFNSEGYSYNAPMSDATNLVFTRD
jgi:hypothetical protein